MEPLIVANWKMNPKTLAEAKKLFNSVKRGIKDIKKVEVVICPPFVYLNKELSSLRSLAPFIKLGSQDCFWEEKGAYTGEISPSMLKDLGCQYVIIGHSERRTYFAETDKMINKKLKAAIKAKISPILCIGESKKERERGQTQNVLKKQIILAFRKVPSSKFQISKPIIAYEPIWAIGSGKPCSVGEAQKISLLIRKIISGLYSCAVSNSVPILYGGSVKSDNAAGYVKKAGLQGLLVGGASLDAKEFLKITKILSV